ARFRACQPAASLGKASVRQQHCQRRSRVIRRARPKQQFLPSLSSCGQRCPADQERLVVRLSGNRFVVTAFMRFFHSKTRCIGLLRTSRTMALPIDLAVVPVAGHGTRLLPSTKSQPKEMLPVGRKPVVQYIVEELAQSGIRRLLFITGPGKTSIENHFDINPELIATLRETGKEELLEELD